MKIQSPSTVSIYLGNRKSYVGPFGSQYPFSYELLYTICRSRVAITAELNELETQQFRCVRGLSTETCSCVQRGVFVLTYKGPKEKVNDQVAVLEDSNESQPPAVCGTTGEGLEFEDEQDKVQDSQSAPSDATTIPTRRRGRRPSKEE